MAVRRTLYATTEMACCRDGDEIYRPLPKPIVVTRVNPYFKSTLNQWTSQLESNLNNKYRQIADDECSGMGATPKLCFFNLTIDNVTEEGTPEYPCPQAVLDTIAGLESRMKTASPSTREKLQNTIDRLKKQYNCT